VLRPEWLEPELLRRESERDDESGRDKRPLRHTHIFVDHDEVSRQRLLVLLVSVAALALSGCSSGHRSATRRVVVTASGRVGPLRMDQSTRADVVSFAGPPESERRGRYDSYPPFDALGYECRGKPATDSGGDPGCKTVFYLDTRSRRLELFYTEDRHYADAHGIHVGTATATVERLAHRHVVVGCGSTLFFWTRPAFLVMWFEGRVRPSSLRLYGGHVVFLVVHSRHRNPGVLDCIDS
jgi:hypothetical protein